MLALVILKDKTTVTDYNILNDTSLDLWGILTIALIPKDRYCNIKFKIPTIIDRI